MIPKSSLRMSELVNNHKVERIITKLDDKVRFLNVLQNQIQMKHSKWGGGRGREIKHSNWYK